VDVINPSQGEMVQEPPTFVPQVGGCFVREKRQDSWRTAAQHRYHKFGGSEVARRKLLPRLGKPAHHGPLILVTTFGYRLLFV
jgi:hypothetical protein